MIITISKDSNGYKVDSTNKDFKAFYGAVEFTEDKCLCHVMGQIADWCNYKMEEECLFEINDSNKPWR